MDSQPILNRQHDGPALLISAMPYFFNKSAAFAGYRVACQLGTKLDALSIERY